MMACPLMPSLISISILQVTDDAKLINMLPFLNHRFNLLTYDKINIVQSTYRL